MHGVATLSLTARRSDVQRPESTLGGPALLRNGHDARKPAPQKALHQILTARLGGPPRRGGAATSHRFHLAAPRLVPAAWAEVHGIYPLPPLPPHPHCPPPSPPSPGRGRPFVRMRACCAPHPPPPPHPTPPPRHPAGSRQASSGNLLSTVVACGAGGPSAQAFSGRLGQAAPVLRGHP